MQKFPLQWIRKEINKSSFVGWCSIEESEGDSGSASVYWEIDNKVDWEVSNKGNHRVEGNNQVHAGRIKKGRWAIQYQIINFIQE